jgi:Zn-dependent alcohol dehydrogenase
MERRKKRNGKILIVLFWLPTGVSVIQGCVVAGAKRIIGVDIEESKVPLAKQFGMTDFLNPKTLPEGFKKKKHDNNK